jgi:NtrC-family two-component system sensor histidine kinase KinB
MPKLIKDVLAASKAGEALKLPFLLEELVVEVQNRIGCEGASILLLNEETGKLEFKVTEGEKSAEIKKLYADPKEGVAGWVFRKGEPLVVNDTESDDRFSNRFDNSTGFSAKSILAVPLEVGERAVGVFELINKKQGGFSREDVGIVISYASTVTVAIENIELYKSLRILEKKLMSLKDYQKALSESLTDGVISINQKNEIMSCNRSMKEMLNLEGNDIIGKRIESFLESDEMVLKFVEGCRLEGKVSNLFCHVNRNGGERIATSIDASVISSNDASEGIVIVVKELDKALDQEELKRKVILGSDLLLNLSHEINTPLTAIQAGIQLAQREGIGDGKNKCLEIIRSNAEILGERMKMFLSYIRAEKNEWKAQFSSISLDGYISDYLKLMSDKYPENSFKLTKSKQPITIRADRKQLGKILDIVYKNAIQYSEAGSVVRTRIKTNGAFAGIYILDQGIGICKKNVCDLFKKFKRFSNSINETSGGLGIGLWLAKYLIEMNGGSICIESREDEGTIVILSFQKDTIAKKTEKPINCLAHNSPRG